MAHTHVQFFFFKSATATVGRQCPPGQPTNPLDAGYTTLELMPARVPFTQGGMDELTRRVGRNFQKLKQHAFALSPTDGSFLYPMTTAGGASGTTESIAITFVQSVDSITISESGGDCTASVTTTRKTLTLTVENGIITNSAITDP